MADMSATDIVTIIGNIAIALSFVIALVFGIAQVKAASRDRRERLTLEAVRAFQTREFAAFIHRILYHPMPATYEELRALPDCDQILFIQFGQEMESLGILVADELINLDLVDKTLGSFVTTAWEKYRPVFTDMRVKTDDPYLGEYFQWLAELIAKRLHDNPRRPYYRKTQG
ncbi:MAG TPA: hypothetical protein VG798_00250 [Rhizomicrobium sp.]|nr:hypothetical protein [Rhizomicrobium sp.]